MTTPIMLCVFPGCTDTRIFSRGWCRVHYNRWYRYGDPAICKQLQGDDAKRLKQHIEIDEHGCWLWLGSVQKNGYAKSNCQGKATWAHIASYRTFVGEIPEGHDIDHVCHNEDEACQGGWRCRHRRCINPDHLRAVTRTINRGAANKRRRKVAA